MLKEDEVIVGKFGSTYGVQGWIKVISYTDQIENILDYKPWYIQQGTDWQALEWVASRPHGKGLIVKFSEINTPEVARHLTDKEIRVRRAQLPQLQTGEYYWHDLKGLTVINADGQVLGTVRYLIETGSNDVLVVKGDKEYAIPYLPNEVILNVDLVKREIQVNWEII